MTSPVNVPANTKIRFELGLLTNPPTPGSSYTVQVTTKDPGGVIIDGPTNSVAYNIKQIGTSDIANGAITGNKIAGISKLIFATCHVTPTIAAFGGQFVDCPVSGASIGDFVLATLQESNGVNSVWVNVILENAIIVAQDKVSVFLANNQSVQRTVDGHVAILVYHQP